MSKKIPKRLLSIIDYVIDYIDNQTNDWFKIKLQIIKSFAPKDRSNFSRRHYSTKKHKLNEFDKEVIKYWEKKTGIKLFIDKNKLHPKDWVHKPKGWALKEINEKRKRNKKSKNLNRENSNKLSQ